MQTMVLLAAAVAAAGAQSIHIMVHRCSKVHAVARLAMVPTISVYMDRVALVVAAVDVEQEVHKHIYVINILPFIM